MARRVSKKRAKKGRPTALTEQVADDLAAMLSRGVYLSHAAPVIGVDRRTITGWMRTGAEDVEAGRTGTPHARLFLRLEKAKAQGAAMMTEVITRAAKRDWRAAAWWLERTHPRAFGPTQETLDRDDENVLTRTGPLVNDDDDLDALSDGELQLLDKSLQRAEMLLSIGRQRRAGD